MSRYLLRDFTERDDTLHGLSALLVIKSQDQVERRRNLLASRKGGRFGRITQRPIGDGLLVQGWFANDRFVLEKSADFEECRHAHFWDNKTIFLTEIDRISIVDTTNMTVIDRLTYPYFAFLHTIDLSTDGRYALITSSGYDAVFELEVNTGDVERSWFAWDHGFNPDGDGVWLAADKETYNAYCGEGKEALLVDPADYGRQGLLTARRTAHPNMAVYDPYDDERSFLLCIGHNGEIYRVDRETHATTKVFEAGAQMPHGLRPYQDGWCLTNTVKGEWWVLTKDFELHEVYSVAEMSGKVPGTENVEWVQQVVPWDERHVLFIDANRGLIAVDLEEQAYTIYQPDSNWCIQDAVKLDEAQ